MKQISVNEINDNIFQLISKDWALITTKANNKINAMTASWLQLGYLWNKNVITAYIRPQRYTHQFMMENDTFSVAFFDNHYKSALQYCGTISGYDEDKLEKCQLTTSLLNNTPVINEARLILVCRKLYTYTLQPNNFNDTTIPTTNYPNSDYHDCFVAEIIGVYTND